MRTYCNLLFDRVEIHDSASSNIRPTSPEDRANQLSTRIQLRDDILYSGDQRVCIGDHWCPAEIFEVPVSRNRCCHWWKEDLEIEVEPWLTVSFVALETP